MRRLFEETRVLRNSRLRRWLISKSNAIKQSLSRTLFQRNSSVEKLEYFATKPWFACLRLKNRKTHWENMTTFICQTVPFLPKIICNTWVHWHVLIRSFFEKHAGNTLESQFLNSICSFLRKGFSSKMHPVLLVFDQQISRTFDVSCLCVRLSRFLWTMHEIDDTSLENCCVPSFQRSRRQEAFTPSLLLNFTLVIACYSQIEASVTVIIFGLEDKTRSE